MIRKTCGNIGIQKKKKKKKKKKKDQRKKKRKKKDQRGTYLMMLIFIFFIPSDFLYESLCWSNPFELHQLFVDAIQMSTRNICLHKEVDKKYTGCNRKTVLGQIRYIKEVTGPVI